MLWCNFIAHIEVKEDIVDHKNLCYIYFANTIMMSILKCFFSFSRHLQLRQNLQRCMRFFYTNDMKGNKKRLQNASTSGCWHKQMLMCVGCTVYKNLGKIYNLKLLLPMIQVYIKNVHSESMIDIITILSSIVNLIICVWCKSGD